MRMRSSSWKRQSSLTPTMRKRTSNWVCALKVPAITAGQRSCCWMLSQSTTPSCPVGVSPTSIFVATTCRHSGHGPGVPQKCRRTTWGLYSNCAGVYRPTPTRLREGFSNNNPELIRQYLDFLLAKDQLLAAAEIAQRLTQVGDPETDDPEMFSVIDRLIAAKEGDAAKALWNVLIEKHWVVADTGAPNNPNFARDPLPVSFDWALFSYSGLHSWPGPSGLETEFSGRPAGKLHNCRTGDCSPARQLRIGVLLPHGRNSSGDGAPVANHYRRFGDSSGGISRSFERSAEPCKSGVFHPARGIAHSSSPSISADARYPPDIWQSRDTVGSNSRSPIVRTVLNVVAKISDYPATRTRGMFFIACAIGKRINAESVAIASMV